MCCTWVPNWVLTGPIQMKAFEWRAFESLPFGRPSQSSEASLSSATRRDANRSGWGCRLRLRKSRFKLQRLRTLCAKWASRRNRRTEAMPPSSDAAPTKKCFRACGDAAIHFSFGVLG